MQREKIVIIGAGPFQNPLILKAKDMGYETHVFAWKCGAIGEETADFFYPVSIVEKEKILEICKKIKPGAVTSIGSDLAVITVNYVSRNLGLNCNCKESDLITTNKFLMRQALKENGIWTPEFRVIGKEEKADKFNDLKFPVIVKPTDRSGSRGIYKVNCKEELERAISTAQEESFEKKAIVEEFIEGEEYSCESISFGGRHYMLAVTRKFTTGSPYFIETGHVEPAGIPDPLVEIIKRNVFKALDALKISNSASHCEFKIKDGRIGMIEIGARMGGDCIGSHLVKCSSGYDFLEMVILTAMGEQPMIEKRTAGEPVLIRFIFSDSDKQILQEAKENKNVEVMEELFENDEIENITDSSTRKGYFILKSKKISELEPYYPSNE